jgi:hypothetical protein
MKCKDCDAEVWVNEIDPVDEHKALAKLGWCWIDLTEPPDVCNGWRCPECRAGWEVIVHEAPDPKMLH